MTAGRERRRRRAWVRLGRRGAIANQLEWALGRELSMEAAVASWMADAREQMTGSGWVMPGLKSPTTRRRR
jgi:hypothetical protein